MPMGMGMTISILRLYARRSVLSYQRRFPVVYLERLGNAKTSVNE